MPKGKSGKDNIYKSYSKISSGKSENELANRQAALQKQTEKGEEQESQTGEDELVNGDLPENRVKLEEDDELEGNKEEQNLQKTEKKEGEEMEGSNQQEEENPEEEGEREKQKIEEDENDDENEEESENEGKVDFDRGHPYPSINFYHSKIKRVWMENNKNNGLVSSQQANQCFLWKKNFETVPFVQL